MLKLHLTARAPHPAAGQFFVAAKLPLHYLTRAAFSSTAHPAAGQLFVLSFRKHGREASAPALGQAALEEAVSLAKAAGFSIAASGLSPLPPAINPATFIGKGKVEELKNALQLSDSQEVFINASLSPAQSSNLAEALELDVSCVHDRVSIILEIFRRRAKSKQAKLQVELAHLLRQKSRLILGATHDQLSQQRGGFGFIGGGGEKKLELDRRVINDRIAKIKTALVDQRRTQELQREARSRAPALLKVALVGYTNSGKSSLATAMLTGTLQQQGQKQSQGQGQLSKRPGASARKEGKEGAVGTHSPDASLADEYDDEVFERARQRGKGASAREDHQAWLGEQAETLAALGGEGALRWTPGSASASAVSSASASSQRLLNTALQEGGMHLSAGVHDTDTDDDDPYSSLAGSGGGSTSNEGRAAGKFEAADMVFATLESAMEAVHLPGGPKVLLTDTVGFISELPHDLIVSFKTTLEDVLRADVILHVRDMSHPAADMQKQEVLKVLRSIGLPAAFFGSGDGHTQRTAAAAAAAATGSNSVARGPRFLEVWNKLDKLQEEQLPEMLQRYITSIADPGYVGGRGSILQSSSSSSSSSSPAAAYASDTAAGHTGLAEGHAGRGGEEISEVAREGEDEDEEEDAEPAWQSKSKEKKLLKAAKQKGARGAALQKAMQAGQPEGDMRELESEDSKRTELPHPQQKQAGSLTSMPLQPGPLLPADEAAAALTLFKSTGSLVKPFLHLFRAAVDAAAVQGQSSAQSHGDSHPAPLQGLATPPSASSSNKAGPSPAWVPAILPLSLHTGEGLKELLSALSTRCRQLKDMQRATLRLDCSAAEASQALQDIMSRANKLGTVALLQEPLLLPAGSAPTTGHAPDGSVTLTGKKAGKPSGRGRQPAAGPADGTTGQEVMLLQVEASAQELQQLLQSFPRCLQVQTD